LYVSVLKLVICSAYLFHDSVEIFLQLKFVALVSFCTVG